MNTHVLFSMKMKAEGYFVKKRFYGSGIERIRDTSVRPYPDCHPQLKAKDANLVRSSQNHHVFIQCRNCGINFLTHRSDLTVQRTFIWLLPKHTSGTRPDGLFLQGRPESGKEGRLFCIRDRKRPL